ncbi:MAG: Nif3-like dinuclear metal center hexameric protein [bacterium]|nr:Nif3-like dinuclear metal center hexameric protein [bacterium]
MAVSRKKPTRRKSTAMDVRTVCAALQKLAPLELAEGWDNVGLLAGDTEAAVKRVMLCIDLMPEVVTEAVAAKVQMVMAYHPPIFKAVSRLVAPAPTPEASVHRCIANGIAVYSMHTALDAAEGGANDVLARLCGLSETGPLEYTETGANQCKIAVFVPPDETERVAEAMFAAGAGRIGDYRKCSFRAPGTGTFFGTESTNPTVGESGRIEHVDEIRLEAVCAADALPAVIDALVEAHSYEEPAYDIYTLGRRPTRGAGRVGRVPRPITVGALSRKLKRSAGAECVSIVGDPQRTIRRVIVAVGAAGSLPFGIQLGPEDVIVTGEIRHHDALAIRRRDCSAIALSHWSSERPVLEPLSARLRALLPGVDVRLSERDAEPFHRG